MRKLTAAHAKSMAAWAESLWRAENYDLKDEATRRYRKAVLSGEIVAGECCVCGSTKRIHGHHEDYSRPFDVVWLCPIHHSWRHRYGHTVETMVSFTERVAS